MNIDYSKCVLMNTKTKSFLQYHFNNEKVKDLGTQIKFYASFN
ncbi:hypothetical protein ABEKA_3274 (plasmid) [Acinetobacter lwoffii]|nr:hypothetical protein ABEKA_3274 [Acinetobacter lwoffii]